MKWIWPRVKREDSERVLDQLLANIHVKDDKPHADLSRKAAIAEKSLREVVHLTEYEDEKANRILTAVAFLSAFAAVMFTETKDDIHFATGNCPPFLQVVYPYLYLSTFAIYAALMTWGAVLVIKGIGPSFNVPQEIKPSDKVKSLLFFKMILGSEPPVWAKHFRDKSADELEQTLFENCVVESYLVAGKIPYKIAFVELGTKYFFWSTIVLAIWATTTVLAEIHYLQ